MAAAIFGLMSIKPSVCESRPLALTLITARYGTMSNFMPPTSYTAYAFKEKGGKLEEVIVDRKDPKAGEVVVKVLACGVCGRLVFLDTTIVPGVLTIT